MTMRVLSLGACQIGSPLNELVRSKRIKSSWLLSGLSSVACYCLGDAMQAIRVIRREIDLSKGMRFYSGFVADERADGGVRADHADIALIDCNTPIALCVDNIFISRSIVTSHISQPLASASPDLAKVYSSWWHKGVLGGDENVKRSAALELIPALDGVVTFPEAAAEILLGMCAIHQGLEDFVRALDEFRREIGIPLAMVTSIYRYLPDGRPLAWPPRHLEITRTAAHELDIPLLDAVSLVQKHGVAVAMNDQLTIYRPEFYPVIGEALADFMDAVLSASQTATRQKETV